MVYYRVAHYLWLKGETYYFNRRVPKDIQPHYRSRRIIICLKTTRKDTALRSAKSLAQRLEDYWLSLRLSKIDIPALHLMHDHAAPSLSLTSVMLKDALALYLRLKGVGKGVSFHRSAERNISSLIEVLGDRPLDGYASSDAASYRDFLLAKSLTAASVKQEAIYLQEISDGFQAKRIIDSWVGFYNSERPHTALDKQTPDSAYFGEAVIGKAA